MEQAQREKNTAMLEWFDALVFALTLVLIILLFFVRTVNVDGTSMVPTLQNGDQLLVKNLFYQPAHGDIVVADGYTSFGEPLIKRVIAVGGDEVNIDFEKGEVSVNGTVLNEPYIADATHRSFDIQFPLTVPEGYVFLLGDNRPYSKDSRHSEIGFIDERDLLGEAFFRIMPLQSFGAVS